MIDIIIYIYIYSIDMYHTRISFYKMFKINLFITLFYKLLISEALPSSVSEFFFKKAGKSN